jgi:hypothetical protein
LNQQTLANHLITFMAILNSELSFDLKQLKLGNLYLSTIQSLIIIATTLLYYFNKYGFDAININAGRKSELFLGAITVVVLLGMYFWTGKQKKLKAWHFLVILSVVALVFNYESTVDAQILDGVDGALGDVGTASGGGFAANIIDAVVDLFRISFYLAIAGSVIVGAVLGVTQGQWQIAVLVGGTILSVGLFLELMGTAVFG